jgi:NitT/TauT family transport system permease protein
MTRFLPPVTIALAALVLWQLVSFIAGSHSVSGVVETMAYLFRMMQQESFWLDVAESGTAIFYAILLSMLFGWTLGVVIGLNRNVSDVSEPILVTFYSLPKVTLYPLVLLVFGLGLSAKVAFGVMHGLVPICLITGNAIRQLRPVYIRTAKVMRLSRASVTFHVVLPAILPELISSLRIGLSLSILGVLIGEMFASKRGLGFAAVNAMGLGDGTRIMAIGVFLSVCAISINFLLLEIESAIRHRTARI